MKVHSVTECIKLTFVLQLSVLLFLEFSCFYLLIYLLFFLIQSGEDLSDEPVCE